MREIDKLAMELIKTKHKLKQMTELAHGALDQLEDVLRIRKEVVQNKKDFRTNKNIWYNDL